MILKHGDKERIKQSIQEQIDKFYRKCEYFEKEWEETNPIEVVECKKCGCVFKTRTHHIILEGIDYGYSGTGLICPDCGEEQ